MAEGEIIEAPAATPGPATGGMKFGHGFLTDIWHFAAPASAIRRGAMARREILGEPVMLGRTPAGELVALRDICPHRASPLSAGRFAREADGGWSVECPYHGWRFGPDGACVAIPSLCAGQGVEIAGIGVRRYRVAESQGLVFVWMSAATRRGSGADDLVEAPPSFPGVVGGGPKIILATEMAAHVDHAVVGLMDPAHGPFVHAQWWWRSRASRHEKTKRFAPSPAGFTMVRHRPSANSRAYALLGGAPQTEIGFRLPGFRWEHVTAGARQALFLTCLTPVTEKRTRITQLIWSDHPIFAVAGPFIRAAAARFLKQDRDMVDLQNQGLKYDPPMLWIDDADRQAKWYQALKREWAASRREGRPFVNPVEAASLRWIS
jgi:phenylpropionate dioxygenase-like ring-hydroxylating dioxygenase large terminal subunit